ncbi:hypothetical protein ACS0TY_031634 [Phlomoides rotata]
MLEKTFGDFLFASFCDENGICPSRLQGKLVFKVSRYIAKTLYGEDDEDEATTERRKTNMEEPKLLGLNPGEITQMMIKPIVLKLAKGGFSIRHRRSITPVPKVQHFCWLSFWSMLLVSAFLLALAAFLFFVKRFSSSLALSCLVVGRTVHCLMSFIDCCSSFLKYVNVFLLSCWLDFSRFTPPIVVYSPRVLLSVYVYDAHSDSAFSLYSVLLLLLYSGALKYDRCLHGSPPRSICVSHSSFSVAFIANFGSCESCFETASIRISFLRNGNIIIKLEQID